MQHLILLHGAIGSKAQLEPLAALLEQAFIIHSFNFSGHGGSETGDEPFSIERFAAELTDYIDRNKLEEVNVFGYSMGGYVAMHVCKQQPHLIRRLVTLATKWQWTEENAAKESAMLNAEKISLKVPAFAEQLKQRHAPVDWKVVLSKTADMLMQMGKQPPLSASDIVTVATPTLLLLGDNDKMVTREETEETAALLKNGKFKMLSNSSHPIEQSNVNELSAEIYRWLCQQEHEQHV